MPFRVVINYQEFADVELEKSVIRAAFPDVEIVESKARDAAGFIAESGPVDAALVQYADVNREVIDAQAACRGYVRNGIGYNNLDADYAAARGKYVANCPHYCLDEVSNHALALLMALNRKLFPIAKLLDEGAYHATKVAPIPRLADCTVGLVGMGNIARALARKLQPLVSRVLFFDPYVDSWEGCRKVSLEALAAQCDYVSIHLPLTAETRNAVSAEVIGQMKPGACVINTGRGGTLDEAALVAALEKGRLGGAALDVFAEEPLSRGNPLFGLPNVILTDHAAWYSEGAIEELKRTTAEQVVELLEGKRPRHAANDPRPQET